MLFNRNKMFSHFNKELAMKSVKFTYVGSKTIEYIEKAFPRPLT